MTDPYEPSRPMICPYNSSHSIHPSRIQRHLIRCERNYPPNYKIVCPYNSLHRLDKSEFSQHMIECPNNDKLGEREHWGNHGAQITLCEMEDRSVIDHIEDWDDPNATLNDISNLSISDMNTSKTLIPNINPEPSSSVPHLYKDPVVVSGLRPPLGRPEALMMEDSESSVIDDMESVKSFISIGRGKNISGNLIVSNRTTVERIGTGRGSLRIL